MYWFQACHRKEPCDSEEVYDSSLSLDEVAMEKWLNQGLICFQCGGLESLLG